MTVYDWFDIEKDARETDVSGFITKPLKIDELLNELRRFVD